MRNRIALALSLLACGPAGAHVMLAEPSALPGSSYLAHFHVGHGCSGSPTIGLRIAIPDGVTQAVPQAKPGWAQSVSADGRSIAWTGGMLAADKPDSFDVRMTLPSQPRTLAFVATQTCESGTVTWSDLPAPGTKPAHPAPLLTVTPHPAMPGMANMPPM